MFFDIGAAQGYFTRVAASLLDRAPFVHAFEMRPGLHAGILPRLESERLHHSVEAHLAGLTDNDYGETDIWYSRTLLFEKQPEIGEYREDWWRRLKFYIKGNTERGLKTARVLLTSIDAFCARRRIAPDILKIDVDGYEGKVIQGALKTLAKYRPFILLELHKDEFMQRLEMTRLDVTTLLFDLGYQSLFLTDHHDIGKCRLIPVDRGDPLLLRQETDFVVFF